MFIILITHTDLDAAGAEFVLRLASPYGNSHLIVYTTPDEVDINVRKHINTLTARDDAAMYVVDLCPGIDVLSDLNVVYQTNNNIAIHDHHTTNQHLDNIFPFVHVDSNSNMCGAVLFYYAIRELHCPGLYISGMYTNMRLLMNVLETINQADHGKSNSQTIEYHGMFRLLGIHLFVSQLIKYISGEIESIVDGEYRELYAAAELEKNRYIAEALVRAVCVKAEKSELYWAELFSSKWHLEISQKLFEMYPKITFVMMVNAEKSTVSLRGRDQEDRTVLALATSYGGGGHPCAAGFTIKDKTIFTEFLRKIVK